MKQKLINILNKKPIHITRLILRCLIYAYALFISILLIIGSSSTPKKQEKQSFDGVSKDIPTNEAFRITSGGFTSGYFMSFQEFCNHNDTIGRLYNLISYESYEKYGYVFQNGYSNSGFTFSQDYTMETQYGDTFHWEYTYTLSDLDLTINCGVSGDMNNMFGASQYSFAWENYRVQAIKFVFDCSPNYPNRYNVRNVTFYDSSNQDYLLANSYTATSYSWFGDIENTNYEIIESSNQTNNNYTISTNVNNLTCPCIFFDDSGVFYEAYYYATGMTEQEAYDRGYDTGVLTAQNEWYERGKADGERQAQESSYQQGYDVGYSAGLTQAENEDPYNIFGVVALGFSAVATLMGIQLFPGITLGTLILTPLVIIILIALFHLWKG